jgi:hypothetical protein
VSKSQNVKRTIISVLKLKTFWTPERQMSKVLRF